jgi:hypothetical protein
MERLNAALGAADQKSSDAPVQDHLAALMRAQIAEEFRPDNHMTLVNNYLYGAMRAVPHFTQENVEIMRLSQRTTLNFYRNALRAGVSRGEIVCSEITAVSFAILGIVQYLPAWIKGDPQRSARKLADFHARLLLDGLRA